MYCIPQIIIQYQYYHNHPDYAIDLKKFYGLKLAKNSLTNGELYRIIGERQFHYIAGL